MKMKATKNAGGTIINDKYVQIKTPPARHTTKTVGGERPALAFGNQKFNILYGASPVPWNLLA